MHKVNDFDQYSDNDIISKVITGDTGLYEIIIRRYNPYLYKIGRSYGYSHADTEDVMQETYLNSYRHLHKFENRSSFKTWLITIMLHQCYQTKQKFSFKNEVPTENFVKENVIPMFNSPSPDTAKSVITKELGRVLENALHRIPEDYRMVFSLRELNGLSTRETAQALQITESNVKVRLVRARSMLRAQIEKMYSPQDIFEFNLIYCDKMVENVMKQIKLNNHLK